MATPKLRVYELSKQLNISNKELLNLLEKQYGVSLKSHSSSIEPKVVKQVLDRFKGKLSAPPEEKTDEPPQKEAPRVNLIKASKKPKEEPQAEAPPEKEPPRVILRKAEPKPEPPKAEPPKPEPQAEVKPALKAEPKPEPPKATPSKPLKLDRPIGQSAVQKPPTPSPARPKPAAPRPKAEKPKPAPKPKPVKEEPEEKEPVVVHITQSLTVSELAQELKLRETEIIKHLFMKGTMVTVNQTLEQEFARDIARDLGYEAPEPEKKKSEDTEYSSTSAIEKKAVLDATQFKNLMKRAPVVSIMGHVDHGKTSLLDAIRESRHKIVDTEAGGITQSIGAYTVEKDDHKIVFIDTPGHEAFTAMRMRGARSTDIAILVVAADDGVMPQTIEAINHAKAAGLPIIVAVNKIDKEDADPDRVLTQLTDYGLVAEAWGGETVTVEVSALQKLGLEDLLEMIVLVSELQDLKADPSVSATGVIIEAQLDKRRGPVATALVQNGTLKVGDNLLIGSVGGRARALIADNGERLKLAGPSTPVEILGLNDVPNAGDTFNVIADEKQFKQKLQAAKNEAREQRIEANRPQMQGLAHYQDGVDISEKTFNFIVKADTQGSAEAVAESILAMNSGNQVKLKLLHTGTGDISEADVMLAAAGQAVIIGFAVREDATAMSIAQKQGVLVKNYDVIYHITEDIEKIILGKLAPEYQEVQMGEAEVRQLFPIGKRVIAGCMVLSGKMVRNAKVVVKRNGKEIHTGQLDNLKRFKEDAKEVQSGYECGISLDKFNDLQEGDIVTAYGQEEVVHTSFESLQASPSATEKEKVGSNGQSS